MGVFCFPAGATLPLHDHPEMVVLSKLLYGSVRVRSYDWVAAPPCSAARKCALPILPSSPAIAHWSRSSFVAPLGLTRRRAAAGGLARVVAADEVRRAPCEASVLFPRSGGNLHAFTAVTPCAILDVLTPPYSEERGRPSTYFSDVPIPSLPGALPASVCIANAKHPTNRPLVTLLSDRLTRCLLRCSCSGFAFLEETDLPEDFSVAGAPYLGPELTVDMDDYDDDYDDYDE